MGLYGVFRTLLIDPALGIVMATDGNGSPSAQAPNGVVLVNLTTHQAVGRLPVANPSGMAISPNGSWLAVCSVNGFVDLFDLHRQVLIETVSSVGAAWDVAFVSRDRAIVTEGGPGASGAGSYSAFAVNFSSGSIIEVFVPATALGFDPRAQVQGDPRLDRAYVLDPPTVFVFNVTANIVHQLASSTNANYSAPFEISPTGSSLLFGSGRTYSTASFGLLSSANDTGASSLGASDGRTFFASGFRIDSVATNGSALIGRFYDAGAVVESGALRPLAVDEASRLAYVITGSPNGTWVNGPRILRAVPLLTGLVDPYPAPGAAVGGPPEYVGVVLSGNLSPTRFTMTFDGAPVLAEWNATQSLLFNPLVRPLAYGEHAVTVSGSTPSGLPARLDWNFSIYPRVPEIVVSTPNQTYFQPFATIQGTIVTPYFAGATVDGLPLNVSPTNGSFRFTTSLSEGGNPHLLRAFDTRGGQNETWLDLLYVPSPQTVADTHDGFSISFPGAWTYREDVTVSGTAFDLIANTTVPGGMHPNFNIVTAGSLSSYTDASVLSAAHADYSTVANLTQFAGTIEFPHLTPIPNAIAATYAYQLSVPSSGGNTSGNATVFQRQYVIASASAGDSWILTFTGPGSEADRYDPLFQWIAGSFSAGLLPWWQRPVFGVPPVVLAGGVALAAAAAVTAVLLLRRRRGPSGGAGTPRTGSTSSPVVVGWPNVPPGPPPGTLPPQS